MRVFKYIIAIGLLCVLSACSSGETTTYEKDFDNSNEAGNLMTVEVDHDGNTLDEIRYTIFSTLPLEQVPPFVDTSKDKLSKEDLKELEETYEEMNTFDGVESETEIKQKDDNVEITITGTENVTDGKSIIGNTEKGDNFEDVDEFFKEQDFEVK